MRNIESSRFDILVDAPALLGEAPAWDAATDTLLWCDIGSQTVHRTRTNGDTTTVHCSQPVTAVVPSRSALPVAARDGLGYLRDDGTVDIAVRLADGRHQRMNDGKCGPDGHFWAGSMAVDQRSPTAALYTWNGAEQATVMRRRLVISNGLDWSPDGSVLYHVDSSTQRIDRLRLTARGWASTSPLVSVDSRLGVPDGLVVDHDGYVWIALNFGGNIARYSPDGELDTLIEVPTKHPTSVAFGGSAGDLLLVTTARQFLSGEHRLTDRLTGSVLCLQSTHSGPPARTFVGVDAA